MTSRQIIAIGGGKIHDPTQPAPIRKYLYDLTVKDLKDLKDQKDCPSNQKDHLDPVRPKICLLPQARFGSSDFESYIANFKTVFERTGFQVAILRLQALVDLDKLRTTMLSSQIIYVAGGGTLTLLAVWKAWGIDTLLREAYANGVILAGDSEGAICWFTQCLSSAWKEPTFIPGLGLLSGTCCPHFDTKPEVKAFYLQALPELSQPPYYAISNDTAIHFVDEEPLVRLVWTDSGESHPSILNVARQPPGLKVTYSRCRDCIFVTCDEFPRRCGIHHNEGYGIHCTTCYPKEHLNLDVVVPKKRQHPRLFACYGEKCRVADMRIRCSSCYGDYDVSDSD